MTPMDFKPLAGMRVLDFSSMMAGPYCGRWLADLGADVIKIEAPEGDYMRSRPPLRDGRSAYFGHLNCGKRSIVLDLKKPAAIELVHKLLLVTDVLLEGFRPGVMSRFGLDYEDIANAYPDLVYCSISGYGQEGPMAGTPAYAAIVHATSGFDEAWRASQPGNADLPTCGVQIADVVAASFATNGIQAALLARVRGGRGRRVDLSLMEGMLALMPLEITMAQFPADNRRTAYRPIKASDGSVIVTPLTQKNFIDLCTAIGKEGFKTDPRFATATSRVNNWDQLLGEVESWAGTLSAAQCLERLERAGVPAAMHSTVKAALSCEQLEQRRFLVKAMDSSGTFFVAGAPFGLNEALQPALPAIVPSLGEHTRVVLKELLALDDKAVDSLAEQGVIV